MNQTHFYKDKPLFGLDIGFSSVKIMQIGTSSKKKYVVSGYGVNSFDAKAVDNGTIIDFENIAASVYELFKKHLVGDITTSRVAMSVPAARTFTRIMSLPTLDNKDLSAAVSLEAEQYIPVPIDQLYIDFEVIRRTEKGQDILVVAVPKKIIDSYVNLANILGLEVVAMETTLGSTGRLFQHTDQQNLPTVIIDFGSVSADVTIYDNKSLVVTGTIPGGGDDFTNLISENLKVTRQEAHVIKTKYGLGVSKKQKEIQKALSPKLEIIDKEIRRMIRYYEERSNTTKKIGQIITLGGGANMPGLSEYLTDSLRVPVRSCNPWDNVSFDHLQPPSTLEKSIYLTVSGLSLINPKEIFA
jgi:type IV pilus assembly protein PilM